MRIRRPDWKVYRAVIAVTALYALALQSLLGSMVGVRTFDPAHILCLQDGGSGGDGPVKAPPFHNHMSCCTAAHVAPPVHPPVLAAAAIVWPPRQFVRTVWRPEITATPRAPPGVSASARAPPVV